jgi:hypothetical protein
MTSLDQLVNRQHHKTKRLVASLLACELNPTAAVAWQASGRCGLRKRDGVGVRTTHLGAGMLKVILRGSRWFTGWFTGRV